jgi:bifunctional oligoribonuclease and PAP phosphatase NrnA
MSLQNVEAALFLREHEPEQIRLSLRAKHAFDMRAVTEVFGGGGHRKAAGVRLSGSLKAVKGCLLGEIELRLGASNERSA